MTENITGRDGHVILKALAYAIELIDRLPPRWQEVGDRDDMILLLNAMTKQADYYRTGARSHIERRGFTVENGRLVLLERETGVVVPLGDGAGDAVGK